MSGDRAARRHRLVRALTEPWPAAIVARISGLTIALFTPAALVWAFALEAAAGPAPGYALGSVVLWRGERAGAATLLAAALVIVLAQLLAGRLPGSIGRQGVEWFEPKEVEGGGGA